MHVGLSNLPSPTKEHTLDFPRLDGGLNNWELDYRLGPNESPEMENLIWKDGALCCRDGQYYLSETIADAGPSYSCYERLFWGHCFFHTGGAIAYARMADLPENGRPVRVSVLDLPGEIPGNRGSWFVYDGALFYKNDGSYTRIDYTPDGGSLFTASPVLPYTPIIQINTEPTTGAGDMYQPENRLSPQKTVWYSTVAGVKEYHLPVKNVDRVVEVVVDDNVVTEYTVDPENGTVTFAIEPEHHNPVRVNTVKITYSKENTDAYTSIMGCSYATVYGGEQSMCVVMGGCKAQPNAYFWNGNHAIMDPGYFPIEQYNLAGDTEEFVTGFGCQQGMLVIFKEHSIGKANISTVDMDTGRTAISLNYTNINSHIGCDLPWTICLSGNNLVFCNTSQGAYIVLDSSSAHENNVAMLSRKVNNTMLKHIKNARNVASFDDGDQYWVLADDKAYVWDYTLSTHKDPSWFYFTGLRGVSYFTDAGRKFHVDEAGKISGMRRDFSDYADDDGNPLPIRKVYQFATQNMGNYDALKDIVGVTLVTRGDTDTKIRVLYTSDYEKREDLTPVVAYSWKFSPRNLAWRYLGVTRFATVAKRRPGCRHVRHFSMRLENEESGTDMSVISAQIIYKFSGRER